MRRIAVVLGIIVLAGILLAAPVVFFTQSATQTQITADGILAYEGSIVGGIITLAGVYITIRYEQRKALEDLERSNIPIWKAGIVSDKSVATQKICEYICNFNSPLFEDGDLYYLPVNLVLENAGRGELEFAELTAQSCSCVAGASHLMNIDCMSARSYILFGMQPLFAIGETLQLMIGVPKPSDIGRKQLSGNGQTLLIFENVMQIRVKPLVGERYYLYRCRFFLDYYPIHPDQSRIRGVKLTLYKPPRVIKGKQGLHLDIEVYPDEKRVHYMADISVYNQTDHAILLDRIEVRTRKNQRMGIYYFGDCTQESHRMVGAKEQIHVKCLLKEEYGICTAYGYDLNHRIKVIVYRAGGRPVTFSHGFSVG